MPVCIAGMHRSGTSMVARLLDLCGLSLGDEKDMLDGAEDNPEGYWEHKRFLSLNEQILQRFQGGWDIPPAFPPHWERLPELEDLRCEARSLLQTFPVGTPWGWKDPRSSLTLPFWQSLIPDLKVLAVVRNPLDVYASLRKRGRSTQTFALDLWLRYARAIEAAAGEGAFLITHYASFFDDPAQEIQRIAAFCGLDPSAEALAAASRAVSLDRRSTDSGLLDLLALDASSEVKAAYWRWCMEAGPVYETRLQQEMLAAGPAVQAVLQEMRGGGSEPPRFSARDAVGAQALETVLADPRRGLYEATIARQQARIASLLLWHEKDQAEIAGWKQRHQELAAHLQALQSGKAWALVSRLRRQRVRLAPPGSLRARIGSRLLTTARVFRREGFSGVARATVRVAVRRSASRRGKPACKAAAPPDELDSRPVAPMALLDHPPAPAGRPEQPSPPPGPAGDPVVLERSGRDGADTALRERIQAACGARPFVVVISHTSFLDHVGGIETVLRQEMDAFRQRDIAYLHLAPSPAPQIPDSPSLLTVSLDDTTLGEVEVSEVAAVLRQKGQARCRSALVHHTVFWPPSALDQVLEALGDCPRFFWIHDYYTVCHNFNLLRNDSTFCGAPDLHSNACLICRSGPGRKPHM
ncbi:MAG TPA: sulfotransferase [Chthonomonadaceae bacterium]|nr:sulfotransferase [Chthonomonadaceae bacterium]